MFRAYWVLLALVVAVLAACSSGGGDLAADASADEAAVEDAVVETATTGATSTTEIAPDEPATFAADAPTLTESFVPLEAGTYRVDTVGTPFSFTTDEPLFIQPNGRGQFVLTDPSSNGPDDRDIVVLRLSALSDPAKMTSPRDNPESEWPANDFAGWLDAVSYDVVASNSENVSLGGLDATFVELKLGEVDCNVGRPCAAFATNNSFGGKDLVLGSTYRVWIVDQGDEDALALIVGINRDAEVEWFDRATRILLTLAFDAPGPNPISEMTGEVEAHFLDGIRFELAESAIVIQEPSRAGGVAPVDVPGDTEFLIAPNNFDSGDPVKTSEDLVAHLEEAGIQVTEIEPTEIDGFEARVFDIGSIGGPPLLTRTADSNAPWGAPPRGRIWLVDHPDRGLLMITAEAFADPDIVFPIVLAQTEQIVESMEFIDQG